MQIKIYTLVSTRNLNEIRYVGKTKLSLKRRLSQHLSTAKSYKNNNYYNNYNYNWINSELNKGYEIIIEELDSLEFTENESWEWLEAYWISLLKTWGFNLTNLTSGGDGNKNLHFSRGSIELRASKIRGIPRNEETKRKISKGLTGIKRSTEIKQKISNVITALQGIKIDQYDIDGNFIKLWNSVTEAAKFYNTHPTNISDFIKNPDKRSHAVGFIWTLKGQKPIINNSNVIYQIDINNNVTKWNNMNSAAKALNIPCSAIYKCCTHELLSTNEFLFVNYNDYISHNYDISNIKVIHKVGQYDLNKLLLTVYNNCTEAANALGLNRKSIAKCCKGIISTYSNYIFKYI